MKIKAILFDLDDTLLDDTKATLEYRSIFYDRHSSVIPYSFDDFYKIWETQVVSDLSQLAKGTSSLLSSRRNRMRIVFNNPAMTNNEADRYISEYLDRYRKSWVLFEDAIPSLSILCQLYPLGIVTNGDKEQQLEKVFKFNLQEYFKVIVSCEDAKSSKPERAIFDFASAQLGLLNSECLFIGDGYERDVFGSLNAGMKPVWLNRTGSSSSSLPAEVLMIKSLCDIPCLLRAGHE